MEAERCVTVTLLYQEGQSTPDYRYRDSDDEIVVDEHAFLARQSTIVARVLMKVRLKKAQLKALALLRRNRRLRRLRTRTRRSIIRKNLQILHQ
ncbi:unnamed protein product [Trifolium pratense]|uniref:Uncharacterized protein n=1 Tax=Trifolium pratense TaxID=57577 RepID=A0ACB0K419_TRIPR|nr:unnamed protein product [Trifolium pratense]